MNELAEMIKLREFLGKVREEDLRKEIIAWNSNGFCN